MTIPLRAGQPYQPDWAAHNIFCLLLALLLPLSAGGCGPLIGNIFAPPMPGKAIQPEYDLKGKTILIWIDLDSNRIAQGQIRRVLTESLQRELLTKKALAGTTPYSQITQMRLTPGIANTTIEDLGRTAQADEVIYIYINELNLRHEGTSDIFDSNLSGYAKMIRSADGQRSWPTDSLYRTFQIEGHFSINQGQNFEEDFIQELSDNTAKTLALYFYDHK